jgi:signal peptide peptidase SppA
VDIKILRQVLNGKWLMEPNAAKQWANVALSFIHGDLSNIEFKSNTTAGVPAKWDVRQGGYGEFFRVDSEGNYSAKGSVQVIMMDAPIMKYDYCGAAGTMTMAHAIMAANTDASIESIVLYMDSPGGSVDGTEALSNVVKQSKKPVVAYVNSMMASAAYWIGSSAKMIMSDGSNKGFNATIGSIGTMASWIDWKGSYEQKGAKLHEVYATESVDKNADFKKMNEGDHTGLIQEVLDPLNETFLSAVKENRAGKIDLNKENVLSGKTYNAKEAMKYGLIDKIGSFEMAIKESLTMAKKQKKMENSLIAFQNTLTVSKAESFEVVENGFLLTEQNLNNIESELTALQASAVTSQEAAEAQVQAIEDANASIALLTAERDAADARTAELEAEVARLNTATPAPVSTTKDEDEFGNDPEAKYLTSVDREAAKIRALRK